MSGFSALQAEAGRRRAQAVEADAALVQARWLVSEAGREVRAAQAAADPRRLAAATKRHLKAVRDAESALSERDDARRELDERIGAALRRDRAGVAAGLDRALPVALLPVRLETRFHEASGQLVLRVRIYPDDVHVDDHEPALSEEEVTLGRSYWVAVRGGTPEPAAWVPLAAALGPHRALWVRQVLEPPADLSFPDVAVRTAGTSRASVARALPDVFAVRVRVGGQVLVQTGLPLPDTVQVGVDMSAATATADLDAEVLVLDAGLRWMAEYDQAEAAGLAVAVPLPAGTDRVDDVTVVGLCVSLAPDDAGELLAGLVASHRVSDGAGFVAPGTPTNNLADTSSGYTERPDPARLDPTTLPVPGPESNAAVLGRALGLPSEALDGLTGAADTEDVDARAMLRATFEATWGPYLRQQLQPAFRVRSTPRVYQHLVDHVRGGGPLPAVRLGRQPYGVLPVQPPGWRPNGDTDFVTWLGNYLPQVRQLWLGGFGGAPTGLAMYAHEAVSSAVRIRTANASSTVPSGLLDLLGDDRDPAAQERRLAAELNLGDALPDVLRNLYRPDPARLWLPMSVDGDLDFGFLDPRPKEATSVLGLLLRNAALQVTSAAADEYRAGMTPPPDPSLIGYQLAVEPVFAITAAAEAAVSSRPVVDVAARLTRTEKLQTLVTDGAAQISVGDKLAALAGNAAIRPDVNRYLFSDAVRAFLDAVQELRRIPTPTRARLVGEALDVSSHRYDAWVTSLATKRLSELRAARPTGIQLGAWGHVDGLSRRRLTAVPDRPDLPAGTEHDLGNQGFVLAPSMRQATVAGVLRAAWVAHGASPTDEEAPFATDLHSRRVRRSLDLAAGMRLGQQLGALLGYQLERDLHDASGAGLELDWMVFELRRRYPLRVGTGENVSSSSDRLVTNGWRLAQDELAGAGTVAASVAAGRPAAERTALQGAVDEVVRSLDGLTDLGLAESVYQLAGRNFDRASAAADMLGRAAVPPDSFDVVATARGSRGVEQRLVLALGAATRPAGWASATPRARLAPEADAFVAARLGRADRVTVRLVDANGSELGRTPLSDLGLAALDLAADAASTTGSDPFPLLRHRSAAAVGVAPGAAADLALDPELDDELIALLQHASAWHQALAARPPLSADTWVPRSALTARTPPTAPLDQVSGMSAALGTATADELPFWGVFLPVEQAAAQVAARLRDLPTATDPVVAARTLFGSDAVLAGTGPRPAYLSVAAADQEALGVAGTGAVAGWVSDTARVRPTAQTLDDALLADDLAGRPPLPLVAAQTPLAPYAAAVPPDQGRRWLGLAFPGPLGAEPTLSVVVVGDAASDVLVGFELDAWVEAVPDRTGTGAVAANFSAPDARAPNTVLLAVPADVDADWTQDTIFAVVDEALELARCRMVDLDASLRVPRMLPACYVNDVDEPTSWSRVTAELEPFVTRYLGGR